MFDNRSSFGRYSGRRSARGLDPGGNTRPASPAGRRRGVRERSAGVFRRGRRRSARSDVPGRRSHVCQRDLAEGRVSAIVVPGGRRQSQLPVPQPVSEGKSHSGGPEDGRPGPGFSVPSACRRALRPGDAQGDRDAAAHDGRTTWRTLAHRSTGHAVGLAIGQGGDRRTQEASANLGRTPRAHHHPAA